MYIHVHDFMKLSEHVHICLYHVQTRMYRFVNSCPGGQPEDSRWMISMIHHDDHHDRDCRYRPVPGPMSGVCILYRRLARFQMQPSWRRPAASAVRVRPSHCGCPSQCTQAWTVTATAMLIAACTVTMIDKVLYQRFQPSSLLIKGSFRRSSGLGARALPAR